MLVTMSKTESPIYFLWEWTLIQLFWKTVWHIHTKSMLVIWPSNCTLRDLSQRNESLYPHKNLYMHVYNTFICNNKTLETAQIPFSRGIIKQTVLHPNHGIRLSNKKGTDYWYTQQIEQCLKGIMLTGQNKTKKPTFNSYILHDFIRINYPNDKIIEMKTRYESIIIYLLFSTCRTANYMLNRSDKSGHFGTVSDFWVKHSFFHH